MELSYYGIYTLQEKSGEFFTNFNRGEKIALKLLYVLKSQGLRGEVVHFQA